MCLSAWNLLVNLIYKPGFLFKIIPKLGASFAVWLVEFVSVINGDQFFTAKMSHFIQNSPFEVYTVILWYQFKLANGMEGSLWKMVL